MRRRRGLVLILAIFFLGLLQLVVLAFARRLPLELYGSVRYELDNAAFLAADAGLQDTLGWLCDRLDAGAPPTSVVVRSGPLNGCDWRVEVRPVPGGSLLCYTLESRAQRSGVVLRTISMTVMQKSLAYYARLVDQWPAGMVALAGTESYDGPVHTNGRLRVGLDSGYDSSSTTLFKAGASYSQPAAGSPDGVDYDPLYTGPLPYASSSKSVRRSRYKHLYGSRARAGLTRQRAIPLPSPEANLRELAWGTSAPPAAPGLYLNASGSQLTNGVYVRGDVQDLALSLSGGDALQQVTLASGDVYLIRERADGTTRVQYPNGSTADFSNHPNGLLYCAGDVLALHGTNLRPHTVAVDPSAGKKLFITGSLLQDGVAPGDLPANGDNALGLICHTVVLPATRTTDFYVYAAVLASGDDGTGGVTALNPNSGAFKDVYFMGSVTTQQVHITMYPGGPTGWGENFRFDPHLQDAPPPGFPGLDAFRVTAYACE